ncbi:hypothetical protein C1H46_018273 [Malus baccata]|uniref:TLC domain-containing protein n=1 Tax=Malus baccata TaxID=106549 RepID=A0A540MBL7_MALBA|nr:hypothetical protein C1H46_018273 [Malus baccata]
MEEQIASVVVLGVISWTTAFLFIRKMLPKRSFDFCNRLVSTVHATVAVTLASLSVQDWNCPVCPLASTSSPRQCGSEMVAALWITELSSPFLHIRELLKELGYRDTDLNLAADAMAVGLQLVSAFWFYKIARMVKYKLTKRTTTRNKESSYTWLHDSYEHHDILNMCS